MHIKLNRILASRGTNIWRSLVYSHLFNDFDVLMRSNDLGLNFVVSLSSCVFIGTALNSDSSLNA